MKFWQSRWAGNQWASIEIEPLGATYFYSILDFLAETFKFAMPSVFQAIDMYAADFILLGSYATLSLDSYSFSIAFDKEDVRDQVFAMLRALPETYFDEDSANNSID
jgi:hypothetical protein